MALTQISTDGIKNGTITGTDLATNVDLVDNQKLRLGNSQDLQIYYDPASGGSSFIDVTGSLQIHTSQLYINNEANTERLLRCTQNDSVELYFDGSKKFETTSAGTSVSGNLVCGTVTLDGGGLSLSDNDKLKCGNGDDLQIFHDASNSHLVNTTGELRIASDDLRLMRANGTEHYFVGFVNSYTALYFDNSIKLQTASSGISVTGDITGTGHLDFGDDAKLKMGASDDLEIFHESGGNSFISNATGYLLVNSTSGDNVIRSSNNVFLQPASGETGVKAIANGAVELYHNNSKKFETTSNGATVSVASGDPQLIITGPGHAQLQLTSTSGTDHCGVNFGDSDDNNAGMIQYTNSNNRMQFHTNGSERLRIEPGGALTFVGASTRAGNTNSIVNGNNNSIDINITEYFYLRHGNGTEILRARNNGNVSIGTTNTTHRFTSQNNNATQITGFFLSESSSYSVSTLQSNCSRNTSNGSYTHFKCAVNGVADKFRVLDSGAIQSTSNSIGGISDERLKENIVDAGSQWNDIKNIKVRKFNFKKLTDPDQKTMLGVIAQEAETVCPGLVESTVQLQEGVEQEYKSFKYSILYMKAVKCLQEAMARIEVLETEVAALKAA